MKLLIVTQKLDRTDPILGFFHGWIDAFAQHCETLTVITQLVGTARASSNTEFISLYKESKGKISQIIYFWNLIWNKRSQYDAVLVHMTPIWIVLGAPVWMLLGKRMYLWYEARGARWPLRVALKVVQKVFSASEHGMPIASAKSVIVGHGIDTNHFAPGSAERDERTIVTVGRITRAKHMEQIINAFASLNDTYRLVVAGCAITYADKTLEHELDDVIHTKNLHKRVSMQPLTHEALLPILQTATLFVHASDTSLDKAVLEAMSTGCPVVSCAESFHDMLPRECKATRENFAQQIQLMLNVPPQERKVIGENLRKTIQNEHSLTNLIQRLVEEMNQTK